MTDEITDEDRWRFLIARIQWVQMMLLDAYAEGLTFTQYVDKKILYERRRSDPGS
jgi:hypothetical protein